MWDALLRINNVFLNTPRQNDASQSMCGDDQVTFACELLDLARASYKMRDDDNI